MERDTVRVLSISFDKVFQLTRSRGAWPLKSTVVLIILHFNSHAHVERDVSICILTWYSSHFNSHAHVERDKQTTLLWIKIFYFNSHAHVERDIRCSWKICKNWISTHTLTWSVTFKEDFRLAYIRFQLTRSRGAWLSRFARWNIKFSFQLTRSRGAWHVDIPSFSLIGQFQLTRSRGAWRRGWLYIYGNIWNFNSHAHVERDYRSWY